MDVNFIVLKQVVYKYYGSHYDVRVTINYYTDIYFRGLLITFLTFILVHSHGDDIKCILTCY